jgi:hypothetical protein
MADNHPSLLSQFPVPVSFWCLELGSDLFEYSTRVLSIFPEGFVITSPRRLKRGSVLSLRLRVPSDEYDGTYFESRCTGCVVAEQRLKDGGVGYKVQLDDSPPN